MKRVQAIMACVALAFLLAACGGSDEAADGNGGGGQDGGAQSGSGGGGSEGASEEQYARGQYTLTEDGAAEDQYEEAAPEDLPLALPPDAEIIKAGVRPDETYLAAMNVSSDREAYEFYLDAVPDAGYEILDERNSDNRENTNGEGQNEAFAGRLLVEGDGYRGSVRFGGEVAIIRLSRDLFEQAERLQQREEERQQQQEQRQEETGGPPPEGEEGQ